MASGVALPAGVRLCPILGTWQETMRGNKVSFDPEVGAPKVRRRGTARTHPTSWQTKLSRVDRNEFWSWYKEDLRDGVLPFIMEHPYEQAAFDWQFAEEPSEQWQGPNLYIVAIQVFRLPSNVSTSS